MKKNGFIATSILYSFFLVFITLFVALITNYLHNQVLISAIDDLARETLYSINNLKFSELEVGEHIKFANIPSADGSYSYALNENATWVIGDIVVNGDKKTYYLFSDFSAQNTVITRKMPTDPVALRHAATIDVMNFLSETTNGDGYKDEIYFYKKGVENNVFTADDFKVGIPRASVLAKIRDAEIPDNVKSEILGVNGDYAVYIDSSDFGGFTAGTYALLRRYNFPMGAMQSDLISKYCGATYDGNIVTYSGNNSSEKKGFGYTHVVDESVNKSGAIDSYVDYCLLASPENYNHLAAEKVVSGDENKNDLITETFRATTYQYRLMAEITIDVHAENSYIAGGRGTVLDPYLMTTGVKQG